MSDLTAEAASFSWLLEKFVSDTLGVTDTIAVSSDGLLLAAAMTSKPENVDRFAALVSGMNSLTRGAADCFDQAGVVQVVVEMTGSFLFIARIAEGSCLGVVAERSCDGAAKRPAWMRGASTGYSLLSPRSAPSTRAAASRLPKRTG